MGNLKELLLHRCHLANAGGIAQAPSLKELGLNVMSAAGLWELRMETLGEYDGAFPGKLKNLKKLDLHGSILGNLDFLTNLTKLSEFRLAQPAGNEDGLIAVCTLSKLKEFIYPVRDLSIYKGHPTLQSIGMAGGVRHGFEAFEGSKVRQFTVLGRTTDEELMEIKKQMERYVKIYTYGVSF